MPRHSLAVLSLLGVAVSAALVHGSAVRAASSITPTPTPDIAPVSPPTPIATASTVQAPSIRITKVDMFRHVGGEFFSTRQIRIGHLVRWIVYFHLDHPGSTLPSCHVAVSHAGHVFYEDAMWRKRGKNYFFLDGRFRSVYGPTTATFTLRQGATVVTTDLLFKVKLPIF